MDELGAMAGINIQARNDFFPPEKRANSQMTQNQVEKANEIRRERNPTTQEDLKTDDMVSPELQDLKRKFNFIDNDSTVQTEEPNIY